MTWKLYQVLGDGLHALSGQPEEGFMGAGRAYNWFKGQGADMGRIGRDVIVMRTDGTRPALAGCSHKQKGSEL